MRIEIEIPDWCDERDILIMAGAELAAFKFASKKSFHIKTTRCNLCGKCCQNLDPKRHFFPVQEGACFFLKENGPGKWVCSLAVERPFSCCWSDPTMWGQAKDMCCIRYDGEK